MTQKAVEWLKQIVGLTVFMIAYNADSIRKFQATYFQKFAVKWQ